MAESASLVWKFIIQEAIPVIQFIPCLAELGEKKNEFAITSR